MGGTLQEKGCNSVTPVCMVFPFLAPAAWFVSGVGVWRYAVQLRPALHQSTWFPGKLVYRAWAWRPSFGSPFDADTTHSRFFSCSSIPVSFANFPASCGSPILQRVILAFLLTVDHLRPSSAAKFFAIQWATITSFPIGVTLSLKKGTFYTCVSFFKHFLSKLRYALLFFFIFIATVL